MELMDKFSNQSTIELMDKFLDKLINKGPQAREEDLGPCNLKRGGTNNLISRVGNPTPPGGDLDNTEKLNEEREHHKKRSIIRNNQSST